MADLHSLIRVRKHAVEQKQKRLADLYSQLEDLEYEKRRNLEDMEEEGRKAAESANADMLAFYNMYAQKVRHRNDEIDEEIQALEGRIEVAREDIRMAFADLKKIEITQEKREDEERAEIDKKESTMLDEIALEGYRRRLDDDE